MHSKLVKIFSIGALLAVAAVLVSAPAPNTDAMTCVTCICEAYCTGPETEGQTWHWDNNQFTCARDGYWMEVTPSGLVGCKRHDEGWGQCVSICEDNNGYPPVY